MPALLKHLIPLLLVVGTMLGAASLVDAHSPPLSWYESAHEQTTSTANMCAYECALVNHDGYSWNCNNGNCACMD